MFLLQPEPLDPGLAIPPEKPSLNHFSVWFEEGPIYKGFERVEVQLIAWICA